MLAEALGVGWEMEYKVADARIAEVLRYPPRFYFLDVANRELMIVVEVDGNSHRTNKWKVIDARKEKALSYLGWKVLRFWNEQILSDLELVVRKIRESTILK
jgi:very-short-patch-repair endonuclease